MKIVRYSVYCTYNIKGIVIMNEDAESVDREKIEVAEEVKGIIEKLAKDQPAVLDGLSTAIGATTGASVSYIALTMLGVSGLSAVGITSGLAAAGAIIGGGMVAGIGVLAAPVAVLGIGGYAMAKRRRTAKLAASLNAAILKLYKIQERLMENASFYKEELAVIKATIDHLSLQQTAE